MKKRYSIISIAVITLFGAAAAYAGFKPTHLPTGDDDKKKTTIEKRIEISDENGEKTVKVTTKKDGKTTVETFTGHEAEEFLNKQEDMHFNGSGSGNFHFKFHTDSLNGNFFKGLHGINDSVWMEVEKEMKEAMEELHKNGFHFDMNFNGMDFNFDSLMSGNGKQFKFYHLDDLDKAGKMLDSVLKDIDIKIEFDDMPAGPPHGHPGRPGHPKMHRQHRIVIAHSVELEDMPAKKNAKEPEVENLGFYPNPSEGDFTVRYESKSEDPIRISVKDISGREVYAETISAIGIVKRQIDLGDKPAGSYVLQLQQGKKIVSKKLIIQ